MSRLFAYLLHRLNLWLLQPPSLAVAEHQRRWVDPVEVVGTFPCCRIGGCELMCSDTHRTPCTHCAAKEMS